MKTFEDKYKDNSPLQTIENIKKFFNSKNLIIKEKLIEQNKESNTWSCFVVLFSNNNIILQTCGKGVNKELALASGYAEMFERFNNKSLLYLHPLSSFFVLKQNKIKNNYFISKEEKITNSLNNNKYLYNKLLSYFDNDNNLNNFLNVFCNNQIIEIPYKNCFDKNDIYYTDPRLEQKILGSCGMAAGNSLEEALVQGISEIFEHYVQEQFFKNPPKTLFYIKREDINDKNLKIIEEIEKNTNSKVKIVDLSYNYEVPVCIVILFNSNTYNFLINFSSAPTIQIAIERSLTELYQNRADYSFSSVKPQTPSNTLYEETLIEFHTRFSNCNQFPEKSLLKFEYKNYNKDYFLQDDYYSNKILLEHYNKICKKLNIKLYYHLFEIDNMKAVHIISYNLNYKNFYKDYFNEISSKEKKEIINIAQCFYELILKTLSNNINLEDINYCRQLLNKITIMDKKKETFFLYIMGTSWLTPYLKRDSVGILFELSKEKIIKENIFASTKNTYFEKRGRKYGVLYDYKISKKYTDKEIYQIFSQLDQNLTLEEIKMCDNLDFLFYKIILEPIKYAYSSESFINMINAYCD